MARAHELSTRGWGRTYPNPLVGAVVVRDDEIVGAGAHEEFGDRHAESIALAAAAGRASGGTLYVTLEPCAHPGKQPPCTDAIIAAGVRRVVVAVREPNPVAAGGAAVLRAAGIEVDFGVLEGAATARNFRFLHHHTGALRPFVAIKLAVSMDGMIADSAGNSRWVSNPAARTWVHWLRAGFGAVGVGGATAIADDARLTVRGELRPRIPPLRVVFDRGGAVSPQHRLFADAASAPLVLVLGPAVSAAKRDAISRAGAQVIVSGTLPDALAQLGARQVDSILIEGGGRLAGALLRESLVDRIYQVQCPVWIGDGTPAWHGLGARELEGTRRWRVVNMQALGNSPDDMNVLVEVER